MPTSHLYQLNEIVELIVLTNPTSVLDIGVGFGKYGFLAREFLEIWSDWENYLNWKRRIDGIEIFEKYLTPVHKFIYDNIYIGNAIDILPNLNIKYDLILLIDVLEHFEYDEGIKLLKLCNQRGRNIIISTPINIGKKGEAFGNPYEVHKFQWTSRHFKKFKNSFFVPNDLSLICYIGEDANSVKKHVKKFNIKTKIKECFPFITPLYRNLKKLFHFS